MPKAPTYDEVRIAVARYPILLGACRKVAADRHERCTNEMFAAQVLKYPTDRLRQVENRLSVMPEERRASMLRGLGF